MTYSPESFLAVRRLFQRRTGLPAVALGIQHFSPQGGGYHEGNDLLRAAGRQDSDYSKRQSARDRPGTNSASAIDIGRFGVQCATGWVDNHRMVRWFLAEIAKGTDDTRWIREIIFSLDDKWVQRYDALGLLNGGDSSHQTHEHFSSFRDDSDSPHIPGVFERFWREMDGIFPDQETEGDETVKLFYAAGRGWVRAGSVFQPLTTQTAANVNAEAFGNADVKSPEFYDALKATYAPADVREPI